MRPRLRSHVQISRQRYRGTRWYVVQDPSSNGFFRLSTVAHEFVAMLDGQRSVEEVWQHNLSRFGDEALTQNDVVSVLSQLYSSNLMQGDVPPETEQLLSRGRDRFKKKAIAQAIGLMYFRVPVFNPNRLLGDIEPIVRPLISRAGLLLWLGLVVAAIAALVPHWTQLQGGFESAIAPSNWPLLLGSYVILKLWHEFGHGIICKRFGGQVPTLGAMMLVLVPSPYVDATAAWGFKNKWQRIAVGAGGMMFELFAAAVAAFGWILTRDNPGTLHQLCYNVMLTSGVATVLFNANPLMKFDGYYMLSDLLEVPNLMPRSMNLLKFLFQKHVYRVENAQPPTSNPSEALILLVYGIAALAYRVLIFISITLYIMGIMFGIGLMLAIWTAAMWFLVPIGQFVHWLATSAQLTHKRPRAVLASLVMIATGLVFLGVIPMPDQRRADGVVESAQRSGVYTASDGFIITAHAKSGDVLQAGDPILTIENNELITSLRLAHAQLHEAQLRRAQASTQAPAMEQVTQAYVDTLEKQVAYLEDRAAKLVLRAPHAGVLMLKDGADHVGLAIREGEQLGEVIDMDHLRIAAVLSQDQADWINALPQDQYRAQARRISRIDDVIDVSSVRLPASARHELPHAALGFGGGGTIETQSSQSSQPGSELMSKRPMFLAYFERTYGMYDETPAREGVSIGAPGERVKLRFTLPSRPLLAQWWDKLDRTLQGRAKI
jgi:putative peptide zinc metalloprotease protein